MEISITCFVVFIIVAVFFIKQKRKQHKRNRQRQGIIYIGQIKQLITFVQQHRGQTAAWLGGDLKVQTKLVQLKAQISNEIKNLDVPVVTENERWQGFIDHWQRLLQLNNKPSIANSFDQHTMMIRNLAYLLEDTAERTHLTADYILALPNIGYVWRELVMATENIGQSRAIGTGAAAQSFCSSVDKIRLNFLTQTMTSITENTLQQLSFLPEEQHIHIELVRKATRQMNTLISTILDDLINNPNMTVNSNDYFELATETMQHMNNIFDHQVKQLHRSL